MVLLIKSQRIVCFISKRKFYSTFKKLNAINLTFLDIEWDDQIESLVFSNTLDIKCFIEYEIFLFIFSAGTTVGFFKFSIIKLDNKSNIKEEVIKEILVYLGKLKFNFMDRAMLSIISSLRNLDNFDFIWSYKPIHSSTENKLKYFPYYNLAGLIGSFMYNNGLFTLLLNDEIVYPVRYIVYNYLYYWNSYMFYVSVIDKSGSIVHTYHKIYVNNNIILLVKLIESDMWHLQEAYLYCEFRITIHKINITVPV